MWTVVGPGKYVPQSERRFCDYTLVQYAGLQFVSFVDEIGNGRRLVVSTAQRC